MGRYTGLDVGSMTSGPNEMALPCLCLNGAPLRLQALRVSGGAHAVYNSHNAQVLKISNLAL